MPNPVSYDHAWSFRRDWVRDGIPWFILPGDQTTAGTRRYRQGKVAYVRAMLAGTSKETYLTEILAHLLAAHGTEQARIEAIVHFVRRATWHNPLECPFEADELTIISAAHELLELHDARCWHAAEIVRQLLVAGGWDARLRFLPSDVSVSVQAVTEVWSGGSWRVLDANYFREGVIPTMPGGALPTLEWLRAHPHFFDRFPGGWIFPAGYLRNAAGAEVRGQFQLPFPEAENTWGADTYYCFYFGCEERYPPAMPAGVCGEISARSVRFAWTPSRGRTSEFVRYDAAVHHVGDRRLIARGENLAEPAFVVRGLDPEQTYSISVRATDEHRLVEPSTWYPATTHHVRLSSTTVHVEPRASLAE
ncbi:MAG TPA: fibronectin type III domain-containing protein [Dongiaceae bacterium]|nr:fibronectin type III domain-containing protein [Dongiaceae bacterium]